MRDDCIFCKIANGEIPSATLYEDEDFRVILDLGPASKGHALILPKEHYKDLCELDDAVAAKVLPLAGKMGRAMKKALHFDGFTEQWRSSRTDCDAFSYAYDPQIRQWPADGFMESWKTG